LMILLGRMEYGPHAAERDSYFALGKTFFDSSVIREPNMQDTSLEWLISQ